MTFSKLDYCQYLLSSQTNFTLTHLAEHLQTFSHDTINRYLSGEKLTPRLLWEQVKPLLVSDPDGYLLFDDTVLDKRFSQSIELVRRQYSGNEHRVIRGIGLISCVYVESKSGQFWVIDYRLYNPEGDGNSKLDHVADMVQGAVYAKQLPFSTVLMDSWYAAKKLMALIEELGKMYYCPLKTNRLVDDSGGSEPYKRIDQLHWSTTEANRGKTIKIRGFPKDKKVKLFRVIVSTDKTEYVATNDLSQDSTDDTQQVCAVRWKIEQFHREVKQTTGIEACQCRKQRIQRNHIACALLVWTRLRQLADAMGTTLYQLKTRLLSNYLIEQLKSPTLPMRLSSVTPHI
ncbi:IS701 family transposase [Egbenema bharatensis]|uniref:IS701 family transposase n=1 Tax=Egbenema bharatensis TaxID=3463334 RepID=UPI003A8C63B1